MNVIEALQAAFGANAMKNIDASSCDAWHTSQVKPLRLITNDEPGRTGGIFVRCGGGGAFAVLASAEDRRFCFYLIHDDSEGNAWEAKRRAFDTTCSKYWTPDEVKAYHTPRPNPRIRLVASV